MDQSQQHPMPLSARCSHRQWQRRRQAARPPAACAASQPGSAAGSKHFLRPSLLATGLTEPDDVIQHCLALFRKADLAQLQQYMPDSYQSAAAEADAGSCSSSPRAPVLPVGPWLQVAEEGPLAPLAGVLDVGARRVLPGHLLRRSQVLSTLRPAADAFQQRIALTACTGETSVFDWVLRWHPVGSGNGAEEAAQSSSSAVDEAAGSTSSSGTRGSSDSAAVGGSGNSGLAAAEASTSSSGGGGRWVLESVRRDAASDMPLPTTPHPKAAPEAIVRAQLAALQQGDVFGASCFSMWHGKGLSSRKTSLGYHHDALRSKLGQEPYGLLLRHAAVQLGAAALPTQRQLLQEVAVLAADGASARFVWCLGMASHGCWMVSGIFSGEEAADGWRH